MTHGVEILGIWCAAFVAGSLLAAALYPLLRPALERLSPGSATAAILLYALIPFAASIVIVTVLLNPQYAAALVPDHCHADGCEAHTPVVGLSSFGGIGLVASGSLGVLSLLTAAFYGLRAGRRRLGLLTGLSRPQSDGYRVVDSPELFAWCCGLWRTELIVSSSLVERLSAREFDAVLAHEREHAARLDNLRACVLRWATICWLPTPRRRMRADHAAASEFACDAAALKRTGDPSALLSALRSLRSACGTAAASSAAFSEGDVGARMRAAGRCDFARPGFVYAFIMLSWFAQVAVVTTTTHFGTEWIAALGTL